MRISRSLLAGCTAMLLLSVPAEPGTQAAPAPAPRVSPNVDTDAMAALEGMGAALRARNVFVMSADVTDEDVLESGEKLQFAGTIEVRARRPDRFKLSIMSDIKDRQIYYDGKQVTVYAPRLGVYGQFTAPATIAQTLRAARERYDIELPLADLFTWGTDNSAAAKLTSGFLVRPETVQGRACNHYAFRQQNVDWQIWIAAEGPALPCKLVITNTADESRPQYTAVMRWTFPTTIADDLFTFRPPSIGANKIVIVDMAASQAEAKGGSK
jgi:hypothetical protein